MGKKVTRQIVRNNMESFAAFVEHAECHVAISDGEPFDCSPVVYGAWAMAQYVQAVIDGETPVDNDLARLTDIIVRTALAEIDRGEDDGEDGRPWLDGILGRLFAEGGDGDGSSE